MTEAEPEMLAIPRMSFLRKNIDPPHRHSVVARCEVGNVEFRLKTNRRRNRWWITAGYTGPNAGFRAANGLTTSSELRAAEWRRAIVSGRIRLADRD